MIDAHQHCWRLGANDCAWPTEAEAAIHRDFLPWNWAANALPLGVTGGLLVQSQESLRDTEWLLQLAAAHAFIRGVVGWADLAAPETIPGLAEDPWLKGLRPMVQSRPADWLDDSKLDAGLAAMAEHGLVFDALVRPHHLPALERMARRHPGLTIVIDHAAKPDIARGDLSGWREGIERLAALPGVMCKLSGLLTEARPGQETDVAGVSKWLFGKFGAERLIWGSDWPVVEMAGTLKGWFRLARAAIPAAAHDGVFGGNARRVYGLA